MARSKKSDSSSVAGSVAGLIATIDRLEAEVSELREFKSAVEDALPKPTVKRGRKSNAEKAATEKRQQILAKAREARAAKKIAKDAERELGVDVAVETDTAPVAAAKPKRVRKPKAPVEVAEAEPVAVRVEDEVAAVTAEAVTV